MKNIKVLSLFDGISCARLALERAGFVVDRYFASEIDKYAIQISAKNFPDIIQIGDVKMVAHKDAPIKYNLKDIDLLIGGSPCQDLSIAKKDRKGLDGERSGLFWEYVRILQEVKPKYFILENVASMPKEAKQIISEALGVEPVMINASLVSAQNRKRLFWVGRLVGDKYEKVEIPLPEDRGILLKDILEENVDEKYFLSEKSEKYVMSGGTKNYYKKPQINPNKAFPLNATMAKMHRAGIDTYISTKRIGQIGKGGQGTRIYSVDGKSVGLSALGGGGGAKTGLYAVGVASRIYPRIPNGEPRTKQIEFRNDEKANSMTSVQQDSMVATDTVIRKLTPIECERLQGLPDNYTDGVSNTQRYKALGNAFNCDVVAHILSFLK